MFLCSSVTDVPSVHKSEMSSQFKVLLNEADEVDLIHDAVIDVRNQLLYIM